MLQIYFSICEPKIMKNITWFDRVIAKLITVEFFSIHCRSLTYQYLQLWLTSTQTWINAAAILSNQCFQPMKTHKLLKEVDTM